ncbi:MAG: hypothetical protein A2Y38_09490 [Spirochaetes bacterium GWB1_59_5]|nr:MAG: hypothetical protein A2Y38_09490 [Spirochaetes bacterium GWB1_59_5]
MKRAAKGFVKVVLVLPREGPEHGLAAWPPLEAGATTGGTSGRWTEGGVSPWRAYQAADLGV